VWNVETGALVIEIPQHARIHAVEYDPLGRFIVVSGEDMLPRFWDTTTWTEINQVWKYENMVNPALYYIDHISSDGNLMLTSKIDRWRSFYELWDISTVRP
jgi:WD40 repeat protein